MFEYETVKSLKEIISFAAQDMIFTCHNMSQQFYMYFEKIRCSESEYVIINGKDKLQKSYVYSCPRISCVLYFGYIVIKVQQT